MASIIAAMTTGVGAFIAGRFRLTELVGQDEMGRLWRGRDEFLDRDVAVKEILLPAEISETERAAFLTQTTREAKSAARLSHPGVITIHDVVEHEGSPWIVTEYIPGVSLATGSANNGPLPWPQVAQLGQQLANALAYAHERGIVHRDLKPDNILLAGDRAVITDFGIARIMDATSRVTNTGTALGNPQYMAPEQLEGRQADAAADVWSLGAALYTAVEGRPPFDGPTRTALVTAILARDPAPAVHAGPLAGLLARMLAKDPAQRPTATAVAQELGSSPPAGYPAQPASSGRPALQSPPGARTALAGLVVSLVAGVAEIASNFVGPPPYWNLSAIPWMIACAVTIITTVTALSAGRYRRALLPAVAGLWTISLGWAVWDVLALVAFGELGFGRRYAASFLTGTFGDITGLVAAVLLFVSLNRSAERRQHLIPGFPRIPLFGCGVIGVVAFMSERLSPSWGPYYSASYGGGYIYSSYPYQVEAILLIVLAVFVGWYALVRQGRIDGGVLLLGWYVSMIFYYTFPLADVYEHFTRQATALNVIAGLCLGVGLLFTIAYLRARPSAPATAPG